MIISNFKNVEKEILSLKHKYGLNFNLSLINLEEFPKIKKEKPELWEDLKLNALVFEGQQGFFYWMYQNESN
jgi:MoaA/NifB/PqqE/SkfB family radical SAM enzyme